MRSEARADALVLLGSTALLGGALAFQFLGGLTPCEMCYWQRWPHLAAIVLGLAAWALGLNRALIALAALAVLTSGAIGLFHAGVEQMWWRGPSACTAPPLAGSSSEVLGAVLAAPLVRCDAIPWSLFGISMAGYNALFSGLIGAGALWLLTRKR